MARSGDETARRWNIDNLKFLPNGQRSHSNGFNKWVGRLYEHTRSTSSRCYVITYTWRELLTLYRADTLIRADVPAELHDGPSGNIG